MDCKLANQFSFKYLEWAEIYNTRSSALTSSIYKTSKKLSTPILEAISIHICGNFKSRNSAILGSEGKFELSEYVQLSWYPH